MTRRTGRARRRGTRAALLAVICLLLLLATAAVWSQAPAKQPVEGPPAEGAATDKTLQTLYIGSVSLLNGLITAGLAFVLAMGAGVVVWLIAKNKLGESTVTKEHFDNRFGQLRGPLSVVFESSEKQRAELVGLQQQLGRIRASLPRQPDLEHFEEELKRLEADRATLQTALQGMDRWLPQIVASLLDVPTLEAALLGRVRETDTPEQVTRLKEHLDAFREAARGGGHDATRQAIELLALLGRVVPVEAGALPGEREGTLLTQGLVSSTGADPAPLREGEGDSERAD